MRFLLRIMHGGQRWLPYNLPFYYFDPKELGLPKEYYHNPIAVYTHPRVPRDMVLYCLDRLSELTSPSDVCVTAIFDTTRKITANPIFAVIEHLELYSADEGKPRIRYVCFAVNGKHSEELEKCFEEYLYTNDRMLSKLIEELLKYIGDDLLYEYIGRTRMPEDEPPLVFEEELNLLKYCIDLLRLFWGLGMVK